MDGKNISKFTLWLVKFHIFLTKKIEACLMTIADTFKNAKVTPSTTFSNENGNPLFNEFTYAYPTSSLKAWLFPEKQTKVIYLQDIVLVQQKIDTCISTNHLQKAIQQLYKKSQLLCEENNKKFINQRGYAVILPNCSKYKIHNVMIFQSKSGNIDVTTEIKCYPSQNNNIVHVFNEKTYYFILNNLLTPQEVAHYLNFREKLFKKNASYIKSISEYQLLEKYIEHQENTHNFNHATNQLDILKLDPSKWEIIIKTLCDSTINYSKLWATDYYFILVHLAKLNLHHIIQFQEKFFSAFEKTKNGLIKSTYEMESVDFGFVFILHNQPDTDSDKFSQTYNMLLNNYRRQKQLTGCIGIVLVANQLPTGESTCKAWWWVQSASFIKDRY